MTVVDDYFNTPPDDRQSIMSAEELMEREEQLAEWQSATAEAII